MIRPLLLLLSLAVLLAACPSSSLTRTSILWNGVDPATGKPAGTRVCLPCHLYRLPIARNHNYRCDTCHGGQPDAKDRDVAHRDLFPHPQDPAVIRFTCQKCHNEQLGKDIPYDAEFVQSVLISHGDYAE